MPPLQDSLSTRSVMDGPPVTQLPVQPETTPLPRRIALAISRLLLDNPRERTARFYGDVLRLDVVAVAGTTSRAYGVAWDAELRPRWELPTTHHQPDDVDVESHEDGARILADERYRAHPHAGALARPLGAKAA